MAYNASYTAGNEKVIEKLSKNQRGDSLVIKEVENKGGSKKVDIRDYFTAEDGTSRPTTKGVRFSDELTAEVVMALIKTLEGDELENVKVFIEELVS